MREPWPEIDRIAPTLRPYNPVVGFQRWRDLLFLHWPVPIEVLRPLVPVQLGIDTFEGVAYVGLVPFWMIGVRPWWAPERVAFRFLETNVRTYVHVDGLDPGVYFFSLEAASRVAVAVARAQFGLPYFWASMRMRRAGQRIEYRTRRLLGGHARSQVTFEPGEHLGASAPGTLEHFLIERYYLHVWRRGKLWRGQVHHTPYPVQRARVLSLRDELIGAAGFPQPTTPPPLVHYAAGVDVEIFGLTEQTGVRRRWTLDVGIVPRPTRNVERPTPRYTARYSSMMLWPSSDVAPVATTMPRSRIA